MITKTTIKQATRKAKSIIKKDFVPAWPALSSAACPSNPFICHSIDFVHARPPIKKGRKIKTIIPTNHAISTKNIMIWFRSRGLFTFILAGAQNSALEQTKEWLRTC